MLIGRSSDHKATRREDTNGPNGGLVALEGHDRLELVHKNLGGLVPGPGEDGASFRNKDSGNAVGVSFCFKQGAVVARAEDANGPVVGASVDEALK